jgi:GNAT superfamily N-acetyltransferase
MANAAMVDSRRELQPEIGAEWIEVAGVYAMFDGPASPLTQTFGIGLFEPFLVREFERVEEFFGSHGAPTFHEVSSFVAPDTLNLLSARGYSPIEASTVLVRLISATSLSKTGSTLETGAIDVGALQKASATPQADALSNAHAMSEMSEIPEAGAIPGADVMANGGAISKTGTISETGTISVRPIDAAEAAMWSRVAAHAWGSESSELGSFMETMGVVLARARGVTCFVAERNGEPIATAALNVCHGVALLGGAATIPTARKQGAQRELLRARLAFAAARGIDLAMVVTSPGGASQRNAERQGFRPVYTRAKWQRIVSK